MINLLGILFSLDTRAPLIGVTKTATLTFSGGLAAGATSQQTAPLSLERDDTVIETYFERSADPGKWMSLTNIQGGKTLTPSSGGNLPTTVIANYVSGGVNLVVRVTNTTGAPVTITSTTFSFRAQTFSNVFEP